MAEKCYRTGKPVYAADNPVRIGGMVFHPSHFTCEYPVTVRLNPPGQDVLLALLGRVPQRSSPARPHFVSTRQLVRDRAMKAGGGVQALSRNGGVVSKRDLGFV